MIDFGNRKTELWVYPKINIYQDKIVDAAEFLKFLQKDNKDNLSFKLYVHFHFCNSFCTFCPYYKVKYKGLSKEEKNKYFNSVINELLWYSKLPYFKNRPVQSVYFGGGDPCVVETEYLAKILETIYSNFNMSKCEAITLEGNVRNLSDDEKQKWFISSGGTRVSFGIQTFKEELRKKLLLKPTEKEIFDLANQLRRNGIEDFTFDMIYNFPDQTVEDVILDAKKAVQLKPMCIDIHNCNVYPNTTFEKMIRKGDYFKIKPSPEKEVEMYETYSKVLPSLGYKRIGPIFFSEKKDRIKYDGLEAVMRGCQILGIGPSARSYLNRRSYRNVVSVTNYIESIKNKKFPLEAGNIASEQDHLNRKMVFFPTLGWIDKTDIPDNSIIHEKIQVLMESGYLEMDEKSLRLTKDKGFTYAGNVADYFTSDEEHKKYMEGLIYCMKYKSNPYNQDNMGVYKHTENNRN